MASLMRAVDIRDGKGDADALFINDKTAKPTAGAGEAVVRIKAFGLNRMDLLQRQGLYPLPPQAPATMGVEFSGVVESLGEADSADTASFAVGDEVFGLAYGGAYAEYVRVSTRMLLHKPTSLGWNEAAGLPETWLTALQALHEVGGFRSGNDGQTTLWHAGASGVSIAGIQLSRRAGAKAVYATAGSDAKCAFVVDQLGATAAFNYKTEDWVQKMVDATDGTGVDLIVDYVGADYFQKNLTVAARDAHIVLLAFLSGAVLPAGVNISPLLIKRVRIEGSSLRSRDLDYQSRLRDRLADVLPGFHSGDLRIFVDRVLPWTEIVEAHKYMEANMSMGKIICTIPW
ncbi:quinone oxidoreductase [Grosmannia clavigera kw1407]|uniref:Quinone oxidoreductase n=1 Tax=Grosmannia clavigera (strain kw1407 / UAMH 11150) TaxID=655863 RepID=F0XFB0_GROCL|nr:quinone oxidoreductase [Grosmannia clavigera kw1407]EFX04370.1 quinone oxidoreductase [Grosmannia clavigera kw1407]